MWGVWYNADEVRKRWKDCQTPATWVLDRINGGRVPLFYSPEQALEWMESWLKDLSYMRYYYSKRFDGEFIETYLREEAA